MIYVFKCERCGATREVALPVDERDLADVWCECTHYAQPMIRQITASRFTIKGYREANGYSDEKV